MTAARHSTCICSFPNSHTPAPMCVYLPCSQSCLILTLGLLRNQTSLFSEAEDKDCEMDDEIVKAMMNRYDGILCLIVDMWPQGIP